jgi:hypothetical protein
MLNIVKRDKCTKLVQQITVSNTVLCQVVYKPQGLIYRLPVIFFSTYPFRLLTPGFSCPQQEILVQFFFLKKLFKKKATSDWSTKISIYNIWIWKIHYVFDEIEHVNFYNKIYERTTCNRWILQHFVNFSIFIYFIHLSHRTSNVQHSLARTKLLLVSGYRTTTNVKPWFTMSSTILYPHLQLCSESKQSGLSSPSDIYE